MIAIIGQNETRSHALGRYLYDGGVRGVSQNVMTVLISCVNGTAIGDKWVQKKSQNLMDFI